MLNMTGIELELLTDINQHIFIDQLTRGGLSTVPNRHTEANNPLITD